ncbi:MAG: plasmid pRiA4b ORF-3 family protein [Bacteroidota bacterium]
MLLQLKITLKGSRPPIWRRVWIRGSRPLNDLHRLIQCIFNWDDSHLHQFKQGSTTYDMVGIDPDFASGEPVENYRISDLLKKSKDRLEYEYDFGDSWIHSVVLEKKESRILPQEPMVISGRRAGPPEDCGGIYRYAYLVEALADSSHPDHESLQEWVGGDLEPEAFDLELLNQFLARFD